MASVLPRESASGVISWRVQARNSRGQMRQETFATDKAALEYGKLVDKVGWDSALAVLMARDNRDASVPTLREWTKIYLDPTTGHLSGVTAATRADYLKMAERSFLQVLGDLPIDVIEKKDAARWVTWQEDQPSTRYKGQLVAAKTIRNYHGVLSQILAGAVDDKRLDSNVARGTKITPGLRKNVTFLTREEFDIILRFVPAYYKPLALFLVGTGMRWGEATALTWSDIDAHAAVPTVSITKAWKKGLRGVPVLGPPKSPKSVRTVSLWPELIQALGTPGPGDQLIFRGIKDGKRLWSERFHKAAWAPAKAAANDAAKCALIGVQTIGKMPRLHDLRHSHASWLIAAGVPLPYIQARLGHEKITTTVDLYGHLLPEAHIQMAGIMSGAMTNVLPPMLKTLDATAISPSGYEIEQSEDLVDFDEDDEFDEE